MSQLSRRSDISCSRGSSEHLFHACQLDRHSRLPFSTSTSRVAQVIDLFHCDLDFSCPHPLWLQILHGHSGGLLSLSLDFPASVEVWHLFHPHPLLRLDLHPVPSLARALQCDNGRVFDNNAPRSFHTHGVHLRLVPLHFSPKWPDRTHHSHHHQHICCLLFQTSLHASYWAKALNTATHLNRLPSKAVSHPTPYFALYGTTPSYDHLLVFSCACYPNTFVTTPHKLSPRSTRCFFLGYSPCHKGYHYLDLVSHLILIFHHVVFDEDVFPLAGSSPPTDLDSLLESDLVPSPPRSLTTTILQAQTSLLAPLPTPRAT
jgi:hypothetical protein